MVLDETTSNKFEVEEVHPPDHLTVEYYVSDLTSFIESEESIIPFHT